MEPEPWAVFSDVVHEVTRVPVDEVRSFMTRRTDESDALLVKEIHAIRADLADLRRRTGRISHARRPSSALPWCIATACALGDLYFVAGLLAWW